MVRVKGLDKSCLEILPYILSNIKSYQLKMHTPTSDYKKVGTISISYILCNWENLIIITQNLMLK